MSKGRITKKEAKRYFLIFLISAICLLIGLTIDNIRWISASPEWDTPHTVVNSIGEWTGCVYDYTIGELIDYVLGYRVYSVWTNWRDISSALTFGFIITLLVIFSNEILGKRVFHKSFIK